MHNTDTVTGPSFSRKNKIKRVIWNVTYFFFFRFSFRTFHPWRSFILRCFGARVGKGVHVYPSVKIWAPWNLILADNCGIANDVILYSQGKITIGRRSVISQGAHIVTGTHDYNKVGFPLITKPILIHDYVWIAADAFIHPGVTVNEGCVIGARSVVDKDMPAWTVCTGHPCNPVKERPNFILNIITSSNTSI